MALVGRGAGAAPCLYTPLPCESVISRSFAWYATPLSRLSSFCSLVQAPFHSFTLAHPSSHPCRIPSSLFAKPALSSQRALGTGGGSMGGLELWRYGGGLVLDVLWKSKAPRDEKDAVDMCLGPKCLSLDFFLNAIQLDDEQGEDTQNATATAKKGKMSRLPELISALPLPSCHSLTPSHPIDFDPTPLRFLESVRSEDMRQWALAVHRLWPSLYFQCAEEVRAQPWRHSLLALPRPFFVPGQRFREMYYWDSYWIVRGLLVSGMRTSACNVARNLLYLLREIPGHFVPNGSRTYYCNRSQPPLLSEILRALYVHDLERKEDPGAHQQQLRGGQGGGGGEEVLLLLRDALPLLLQEHKFWTSDPHRVLVRQPGSDVVFELSRYYALWDAPRPESLHKDIHAAMDVALEDQAQVFREFATVAETGWDFSSRWMSAAPLLASSCPTRVLPADLNGFLLQMERNIAFFATVLHGRGQGQPTVLTDGPPGTLSQNELLEVAEVFARAAEKRQAAMDALMWVQWEEAAEEEEEDEEESWAVQSQEEAPKSEESSALWEQRCLDMGLGSGNSTPQRRGSRVCGRWRDVWVQCALGGDGQLQQQQLPGGEGQVWDVVPRPWPECYPPSTTSSSPSSSPSSSASSQCSPPQPVYASDFLPLWCGALSAGDPRIDLVVNGFQASGLLQAGGVAASTFDSGEQWDFPNCWPPLQHALCEAFAGHSTRSNGAESVAGEIHSRFLKAAYLAWQQTGYMHEKYDGCILGGVGSGGEYDPQVGFGWTNGAVLSMLSQFGWPFSSAHSPRTCF